VLLVSYFALLLVLFVDLLYVLACLHVVKLSSAYVLLTLVIKPTQKLLNILAEVMMSVSSASEGGGSFASSPRTWRSCSPASGKPWLLEVVGVLSGGVSWW
jgi:hypothetical protein